MNVDRNGPGLLKIHHLHLSRRHSQPSLVAFASTSTALGEMARTEDGGLQLAEMLGRRCPASMAELHVVVKRI